MAVANETAGIAQGHNHSIEQLRGKAMSDATGSADKQLVIDAAKQADEVRLAADQTRADARAFYHTVRAAMGAFANVPDCSYWPCGENADCVLGTGCLCRARYVGDGITCTPRFMYSPMRVPTGFDKEREAPNVVELQVVTLSEDTVLVAFRDAARGDAGFLRVGRVGDEGLDWSLPSEFAAPAFGLALVAMSGQEKRFVAGYRDMDEDGTAYLLLGTVCAPSLEAWQPGAVEVKPQQPTWLADHQAHQLALVQLHDDAVACFYVGHDADNLQSWGQGIVMKIQAEGPSEQLVKADGIDGFRFTNKPVTDLSAIALSQTRLVVAYRVSSAENDAAGSSHELSATWLDLNGTTNQLTPDQLRSDGVIHFATSNRDVGNRDVAAVASNIFAYTFEHSGGGVVNAALVHVGPPEGLKALSMVRVSVPEDPGRSGRANGKAGETTAAAPPLTFLKTVREPPGAGPPHTFTYFQVKGRRPDAQICRVPAEATLQPGDAAASPGFTDCKHLLWADTETKAASAVRVPDGRLLFVYADLPGALFSRFLNTDSLLG